MGDMGTMPVEATTAPTFGAVRSESVGELMTALAKAQGEFEVPKKTRTATIRSDKGSYEYKYADLSDLVAAVQIPLTKYEIAWTQDARIADMGERLWVQVVTRLYHGDEMLEFGPLAMPVGQMTPQGIGSAITYAKRYALGAALGVPSEADDDGQAATAPAGSGAKTITQRQLAALHALAGQKGVTHEKLHAWAVENLGVGSVKELSLDQARHIMDKLHELPDKESDVTASDAAARSEDASKTSSDAAPHPSPGPDGTDQQVGEGASSPTAAVATKDEWTETEKLIGSRRAVIALYQDYFQHPKAVRVSDVTGEQLAELREFYANTQAAKEQAAE